MKHLLSLLCLLSLLSFCAEIDLNGTWRLLTWEGYKPFPEVSTKDGVLHVAPPESKSGIGIKSSKTPNAKAGDRATLKLNAKGRGSVTFVLQHYDANGKWIGFSGHSFSKRIPEEWADIELTVPVSNTKDGITARIMITFTLGQGSTIDVRQSSLTLSTDAFEGDLPFPLQWTVFPMHRPGETIDFPLDRIPEEIDGVKPITMPLKANVLSFTDVFNPHKLRNNAILYATLNAKFPGRYTIGAGADYFMKIWMNGEVLIDTLKSGDESNGPHFTKHQVTADLKQGKNLIVVNFQTGSSKHPAISLGGPEDLRNLTNILRIKDSFVSDDYETPGERSGNPTLVKGILTEGIDQLGGQAQYTNGSVIAYPDKRFNLPARSGDAIFAAGFRLHSFKGLGKTTIAFGEAIALEISRKGDESPLLFAVRKDGKELNSCNVPIEALPCECLLAVTENNFFVTANSINDSKLRSITGKADLTALREFQVTTSVATDSITIDNYFIGTVVHEIKSNKVPVKLDLAPEFDPVKAGWKLVWSDEFDGTEVDWTNTWMNSPWAPTLPRLVENRKYASLKDGMLHIRCEWKKNEKGEIKGHTIGLYSRKHFGYGYYEARLRFTKHKGWWAAFWMNNEGRNNQLGGGYEIDIFEDYSTRGGKHIIANNLHITRGPNHNSYGYHFNLPGSLDDFYVIGLKWTPLEVSTYLNGKLIKTSAMHSPYMSDTYDAISHAFCTTAQYICLSGQCGQSGGKSDEEGFEEYLVDYVRAYEYPAEKDLKVNWTTLPQKSCVKTGEPFQLGADGDGETAYLFDNGFLVDYKSSKPFVFDLAIDHKHYDDTRWDSVGRQGTKPVLDGYPHIYRILIQDKDGKVGYTNEFPMIADNVEGTPEEIFPVPGDVPAHRFNRGGQNVCAYKQQEAPRTPTGQDVHNRKKLHLRESGEYVTYTIEAKEAGRYRFSMPRYEYRRELSTRGFYFIDGKFAGVFHGNPQDEAAVAAEPITLTAGRHTVILMSACAYGLQPACLRFEKLP